MTSCDSPAVDLSGAKDFRPVEPVTGHSGAFYFLLSFSYVASHPPRLGPFTQAVLPGAGLAVWFLGREAEAGTLGP